MGAISILVLVLACAASSYALPGGAPTSTCVNLTPGHPAGAQSNPGPYEIDISAFMNSYGGMPMAYLPGAYYTITLRARTTSANTTFRGFLIQARDMDGNPVGAFLDPSADQPNSRLSSCEPPEIAVTHVQPGNATLRVDLAYVTFTWRAPTTIMTGPIRFWFTTVQRFATYWVAETTDLISEIPLTCPGASTGGAGSVTSLGVWALLSTAILTALKVSF